MADQDHNDDDIFAALAALDEADVTPTEADVKPAYKRNKDKPSKLTLDEAIVDATMQEALAVAALSDDPLESVEPLGSADDPFSGGFRTCFNDNCPIRTGCMRFLLRKTRDVEMRGIFFADEGAECHIRHSDPLYYGKFEVDHGITRF